MTGVDIRGPAADGRRILEPGKNCWRVEPGSRGAVLIDGASYFGALRAAFLNARRSILILGWDIDSRLGLVGVAHDDDLPVGLSDFLNALTARRPELRVRVLSWDFAMIYAMEREWLSAYRLGWMTGSGVDFRLDDRHPVGASHHQKIAVIDDRLAFVGGIDLSKWRWDTPDHDPGDPRRKDADGNPYPPFHDLQWMVEGEVAAAVGELARERWRRATDQAIEPSADDLPSPWPDGVDADFVDCPIAIARTDPELGGRPAVREVERLYVDAVRQARNFIYVENQYLTCAAVADVLAERLREPDAPETVIVLPLKTGGWLEQYTMDVLRARLLRGLREADRHDRLRVYYPHVPGLEPDTCLGLHSKLMIVDDRLLRFGSANLSNRSMGLDTECDLAFEAADAAGRRFVSGVLTRLVAEHLGSTESEASKVLEEEGSLIAAIERLSGSGRSLRPLEADVDEDVDRLVPDAALLDPEQPVLPETLVDRLVAGEQAQRSTRRQLMVIGGVLLAVVGLALAWRYTPLREWADPSTLKEYAAFLERGVLGPLIIIAVFVVWGMVAAPLTPLVVACALIFGALPGFLYSLAGGTLSALVTYWMGQVLGKRVVRRVAGARLNRLSRRLARNGVLAVVAVRIVPVAPFTVINLVAGASHIRLRDFALGTVLGFVPGMAAIAIFADRLAAAVKDPGWKTMLVLAVVGGLLIAGFYGLRRWMRRSASGQQAGSGR